MKILFYINTINLGGAERVMTNLASQFSENGYETILVTSYFSTGEYELNKKVKRLSLENEQLIQSRIKRNITRIKKLRDICKKEKPDVVISFMGEPNFRNVIANLGLPTKTVVSVRNDPKREYSGLMMKLVGKIILPMADGCVFQTDDARKWFPKRLQAKSTIIFNPVKDNFYDVVRKVNKNEIVTCGRLTEQKNHKLLIDSIYRVYQNNKEIKLLIYGEGDLKAELKEYVKGIGLEKVVLFMGNSNDVPKVLSTASLFILSSDYEGMPNALMEALAVGVPCISTDCPCGGPRMLIEDGMNGFLFSINDQERLVYLIKQVLKDEILQDKISRNAIEKAREYKTQRIFEEWEEFIKGL